MKTATSQTRIKISTKIALIAVCPVVVALAVTGVMLLIQQQKLDNEMDAVITQQVHSEAAKIAQSVYLQCASTEGRNQAELSRSLIVVEELLQQAGGASLGSEKVEWRAINQVTKQVTPISLPELMVGTKWLGQVGSTSEPAQIVDEAKRLTGVYCTVFQRMNETGDMLRVCTSVVKEDGARAVGTFIPAENPDGAKNSIIAAVLRGETYHGRAFVVKSWHTAVYEPIWDGDKKQVIGMLYVGIDVRTSNRELCEAINKVVVGKTGYVFVLGGKGDERGKYLVSHQGKRNGESIWETKDATGRLFVQSIVEKGLKSKDGAVDFENYTWQNPGEPQPRRKFAAIVGFPQWDWIIGAGTYDDDFADVREQMDAASRKMVGMVATVATVAAILALVLGVTIARSIARPVTQIISELGESSGQIAAAAGEVAGASQSLAKGASEQAASLEETSSSLEEMGSMTKRNAENAAAAKTLAGEARQVADVGASDMEAMGGAMNGIKSSSDEIAKIIKTIDEIAFQTNILALNAAVEAARAGEAGMGFAVVAEEVRNLAQRSASASRETAEKIESAIVKTSQGVAISGRVGKSLGQIVEKVRRMDELLAEVAKASQEQSHGVDQINVAVAAMDKVVQTNAAGAEESASASEELNAQALSLRESIVGLRILVDGVGGTEKRPAVTVVLPVPQNRSHPTRGRAKSTGMSVA